MIEISDNASRQILKMLAKAGLEGGGLRVGLKAGGCSGFEYVFAWEREPRPTDETFAGPDGSRIFVDPKSYRLLKGTLLDYDTSLLSKGFVFNNPNAKSTCGCGLSFSVADSQPAPADSPVKAEG
jgi:iron-sulfur cluster assembly protein